MIQAEEQSERDSFYELDAHLCVEFDEVAYYEHIEFLNEFDLTLDLVIGSNELQRYPPMTIDGDRYRRNKYRRNFNYW